MSPASAVCLALGGLSFLCIAIAIAGSWPMAHLAPCCRPNSHLLLADVEDTRYNNNNISAYAHIPRVAGLRVVDLAVDYDHDVHYINNNQQQPEIHTASTSTSTAHLLRFKAKARAVRCVLCVVFCMMH